MPRFFVNNSDIFDGHIVIRGDDAHHISHALRMAVGEKIVVCDTDGTEHFCELERFGRDAIEARIVESRESHNEPSVEITLYQAYPKGEKSDYIVQKAVELGVSKIVFFESSRCVSHIIGDKQGKKLERYSRIALEAAKQCGRAKIPIIEVAPTFDAAIYGAAQSKIPLFCYEGQNTRSLKEILPSDMPKSISVVIGSEGGFSECEAEAAVKAKLLPTGLGNRILRTETASGFVLSCISLVYEL